MIASIKIGAGISASICYNPYYEDPKKGPTIRTPAYGKCGKVWVPTSKAKGRMLELG